MFSSLQITAGHQYYRTNQVSIMVVFQDDSVKFLEVLIFRTPQVDFFCVQFFFLLNMLL